MSLNLVSCPGIFVEALYRMQRDMYTAYVFLLHITKKRDDDTSMDHNMDEEVVHTCHQASWL